LLVIFAGWAKGRAIMTARIAVGFGIALFALATGGSCSAYHVASPPPDPTIAKLASMLLHQPLPLPMLQTNLSNEVLEHPTPDGMLSDGDRPLLDAFGPAVAQRMSLLAHAMWLHIGTCHVPRAQWVAAFDRTKQICCAKGYWDDSLKLGAIYFHALRM